MGCSIDWLFALPSGSLFAWLGCLVLVGSRFRGRELAGGSRLRISGTGDRGVVGAAAGLRGQ